jgi:uncharacterized protein with von Willebrand factor type A (vWA) domain
VPIRPVGGTIGNDLDRLLPHELARGYIDHPLVKATFICDFAERRLLQFDVEGVAPAGKGPVIPICDGSGSMAGENLTCAVSLVLPILTICRREKREFAAAQLGPAGQLKSWIFRAREPADPHQVLDLATRFFASGTDITTGLAEAVRIMREHPAFKTADVIVIGDGIDTP